MQQLSDLKLYHSHFCCCAVSHRLQLMCKSFQSKPDLLSPVMIRKCQSNRWKWSLPGWPLGQWSFVSVPRAAGEVLATSRGLDWASHSRIVLPNLSRGRGFRKHWLPQNTSISCTEPPYYSPFAVWRDHQFPARKYKKGSEDGYCRWQIGWYSAQKVHNPKTKEESIANKSMKAGESLSQK